jgi:hypothetical protein
VVEVVGFGRGVRDFDDRELLVLYC